jgi:hypothetical protein
MGGRGDAGKGREGAGEKAGERESEKVGKRESERARGTWSSLSRCILCVLRGSAVRFPIETSGKN